MSNYFLNTTVLLLDAIVLVSFTILFIPEVHQVVVTLFFVLKLNILQGDFMILFLQTNFAIFPHVLQKKKDDNIKKGVDVKKFLFNLKIHICRQISTILAANFLCYIAKTRMSTSISSEAQKYKTI